MHSKVTPISRSEIETKLKRGDRFTLVEALPAHYYNQAHLPDAINLPHDVVDKLAPQLLPDKTTEIVVYCANTPCQNSAIAAQRLAALGYTRVHEYVEGKQDWIDAGLPIEGVERRVAHAQV